MLVVRGCVLFVVDVVVVRYWCCLWCCVLCESIVVVARLLIACQPFLMFVDGCVFLLLCVVDFLYALLFVVCWCGLLSIMCCCLWFVVVCDCFFGLLLVAC